jgi:hypothetical protein
VDKLGQWQQSGGTVRIVQLTDTSAVVDLCSCTGEPMERWSTVDRESILQIRTLVEAGETRGQSLA